MYLHVFKERAFVLVYLNFETCCSDLIWLWKVKTHLGSEFVNNCDGSSKGEESCWWRSWTQLFLLLYAEVQALWNSLGILHLLLYPLIISYMCVCVFLYHFLLCLVHFCISVVFCIFLKLFLAWCVNIRCCLFGFKFMFFYMMNPCSFMMLESCFWLVI